MLPTLSLGSGDANVRSPPFADIRAALHCAVMRRPFLVILGAVTAAILLPFSAAASPYHDQTVKRLELKRAEPYSRARSALAARLDAVQDEAGSWHSGRCVRRGCGARCSLARARGLAFRTLLLNERAKCALVTHLASTTQSMARRKPGMRRSIRAGNPKARVTSTFHPSSAVPCSRAC
jgi:hypothetical protein